MGGFCGYCGSVWVMGEWAVGHWIVGVTSFQKIYGLYRLKHHIVEMLPRRDGRTTRKDRATQLLICASLSFATKMLTKKSLLFSGIPFAMGEMLPTVIGYFVKDWSMFQLTVSLFMVATCFSWFLLPESPRYLISKGKVAQVTKVLEKAAKRNGVKLSTEVMAANNGQEKKEEEVLEVNRKILHYLH